MIMLRFACGDYYDKLKNEINSIDILHYEGAGRILFRVSLIVLFITDGSEFRAKLVWKFILET